MQEPCENRFCSLLLFEFREINHFLEIYHRDPRKILRASRNSILETRASILDSVNLHLHGTVGSTPNRSTRIFFSKYASVIHCHHPSLPGNPSLPSYFASKILTF